MIVDQLSSFDAFFEIRFMTGKKSYTHLYLIYQALDWNLRGTTAATFVEMFYAVAGKGRKPLFKMAKAILDLCLYKV